MIDLVSENYFKYDNSEYARGLRAKYGADGYQKYKVSLFSENPITLTKKAYIAQKEQDYKLALGNLEKAKRLWNSKYKTNYSNNLFAAKRNNNGYSLTGAQKQAALQNCGDGAVQAFHNLQEAQSNVDFALSLYNDATHSGMTLMS